MSRTDLDPINDMSVELRMLMQSIEEIKKAQRIGKDILEPKIIEALDASGNPTTFDLTGIARTEFAVRFQAKNQKQPFGVPLFKLGYGNPNTPPTANQAYGFIYPRASDFAGVDGRVTYKGWFGNNVFGSTTPVYLKVFFYATDYGTLTVNTEPY